eukprot:g1529.t1
MGSAASVSVPNSSTEWSKLLTSASEEQLQTLKAAIATGDKNGTSLLQLQMGLFNVIQGAAYRSYHVYFAKNFHSHHDVKALPYTFPNFVAFVRVACDLYKSLDVVRGEKNAEIIERVATSCEDELERLKERIRTFNEDKLDAEQKKVHDKVLVSREKSEDTKEDFRERVQATVFNASVDGVKKKSAADLFGSVVRRAKEKTDWEEDEREDERREKVKREYEQIGMNEGFESSPSTSTKHAATMDTSFLNEWRQVLMTSHDESVDGAMVPIRFWYETFMPNLLAAFSIGDEAEKEFARDGFVDGNPDKWFEKTKNELARYGSDVIEAWERKDNTSGESSLGKEKKIDLMRAWRIERHYLNGILKQREREFNTQHRSTGALTQYVAFLDVYVGRSFVKNAGMRLTFPYLIGPGAWLFKHTVAEICCSSTSVEGAAKKTSKETTIVDAFKSYFKLFATMYACPYCRGHLNQFVVRTKETDSYPIEYSLLGWKPTNSDNKVDENASNGVGRFEITLDEKLATITDGPSLRLFVWKLHNAVSSSISRTESWYRPDPMAVYTSRWWPNIDAELQRAERDAGGLVAASSVNVLLKMVKIGVKLNLLREAMHSAKPDEVRVVCQNAQGMIRAMDALLHQSGILQRVYSFSPGQVEARPAPPDEDEATAARSEDFTLN